MKFESLKSTPIISARETQSGVRLMKTLAYWFMPIFSVIAQPYKEKKHKKNSVALVRKQTIPTERPPLFGEVSANFCG
jgi:hypothetical protein